MQKTDILIIGAGPIGLEIAGVFKRAGLDYLHLEAGQIGQSMMKWPRHTRFFSSPEWIAICGIPIQNKGQTEITGEDYLAYLRLVVETLDLEVRTFEKVLSIEKQAAGFKLISEKKGREIQYQARSVVFTAGDMSFPRLLNIPGEELPHVSHYFSDPHLYFRQKLLIVGGRNSALEALLRCWRSGAQVSLSYRKPAINKDITISRLHLETDLLIKNRKIQFYPETRPLSINRESVILENLHGENLEVPADFVLLNTGYIPDQSLLLQAGVELKGEESVPVHNPQTMETNIKGLFVAGTAAAGNQQRYRSFITTSHPHGLKILKTLCPELYGSKESQLQKWIGNYARRHYALLPEDIE